MRRLSIFCFRSFSLLLLAICLLLAIFFYLNFIKLIFLRYCKNWGRCDTTRLLGSKKWQFHGIFNVVGIGQLSKFASFPTMWVYCSVQKLAIIANVSQYEENERKSIYKTPSNLASTIKFTFLVQPTLMRIDLFVLSWVMIDPL